MTDFQLYTAAIELDEGVPVPVTHTSVKGLAALVLEIAEAHPLAIGVWADDKTTEAMAALLIADHGVEIFPEGDVKLDGYPRCANDIMCDALCELANNSQTMLGELDDVEYVDHEDDERSQLMIGVC